MSESIQNDLSKTVEPAQEVESSVPTWAPTGFAAAPAPREVHQLRRMSGVGGEQIISHVSGEGVAQLRAGGSSAAAGCPNTTGMPDQLKAGVESLSGVGMDDVTVHYNSPQPVQMRALAFAKGTDIHVAPGQERHLAHEAWHVVQQKQGRVAPTTQLKGVGVNDDAGLEREADVMGARAEALGASGATAAPVEGGATQLKQAVQLKGVVQRAEETPEQKLQREQMRDQQVGRIADEVIIDLTARLVRQASSGLEDVDGIEDSATGGARATLEQEIDQSDTSATQQNDAKAQSGAIIESGGVVDAALSGKARDMVGPIVEAHRDAIVASAREVFDSNALDSDAGNLFGRTSEEKQLERILKEAKKAAKRKGRELLDAMQETLQERLGQTDAINQDISDRAGQLVAGQGAEEVQNRAQHEQTLIDLVTPVVAEQKDKLLSEVRGFIETEIGADGIGFFSNLFGTKPDRKAFREDMKRAARDQAKSDARDELDEQMGGGDRQATRAYVTMNADQRIYDKAKESVNKSLNELATEAAEGLLGQMGVVATLTNAGTESAWGVLRDDPTRGRTQRSAGKAGKKAIKAMRSQLEAQALARAAEWRNSLFANEQQGDDELGMRQQAEQEVREQTTEDEVGVKAVEESIKANTTDEGMGKVGQLLDRVLPSPGDQAALSVQLQIPIGESPGYVVIGIEGKAARGIDGAVTAGVPVMGDPNRMEVQFTLTLGAGVETWGLKAEGSVSFFLRSGGKDTRQAMQALSYGAYRAACGLNDAFGNWWAGKPWKATRGTGAPGEREATKLEKAESWAAMVEEQAFANEDDGAFVDLGMSGKIGGGINVGVASVEGDIGGAGFNRWDHKNLKKSLNANGNDDFASPVNAGDADKARRRRDNASGKAGYAVGGSVKVTASILGQKVVFSASLSGSGTDFENNWGLEIAAEVSLPPGADATTFEKIAAGIVAGSLSAAQAISSIVKNQKKDGGGAAASTVDIAADAVTITNAGTENVISSSLAELWQVDGSQFDHSVAHNLPESWTGMEKPDLSDAENATPGLSMGSSIGVAIIMGRGDGKGIFRVELRSSKSMDVKVGTANVGLSVSANRSKRLAAVGYDEGSWKGEILGNRIGQD